MHLAGSKEEYDFVKYGSSMLANDVREEYDAQAPVWLPTGVSPVRYVLQWGLFDAPNVLAVHCTQVDDDDIEILAAHDVAIAYCPRCNAKLAMGAAPGRQVPASGTARGPRHGFARCGQLDGPVRGHAGRACSSSGRCSAPTSG